MTQSIKKNAENNKEHIDSNIFLSLFEHSLSGILYGNPDNGNIYDANHAAADMFGYTIEELRKLNRNDIFDFKHHTMVSSLKKRQENGSASGELIGIRKNGELFPCEFSSSIFKNEKGENRTSTILNDISERKKVEEEIMLLLNNTEESFVLVDLNLKIISFNHKFKQDQKLYFNKEAVKGDSILDYGCAEKRKEIKQTYSLVLSGETIERDLELVMPTGEKLIHSQFLKPAIDFRGNLIGIFITSRDITEKRKAQDLVISNEKRFRSIIEHTGDLISMTDENGNLMYISPSVEKTLGLSKDEALNKSYKFAIHPDHLEESKEVFKKLIANPGIPFYRITRILHKDGHYIWVEGVSTNLLHDENVKAIVSNYRDITEKVIANQKLEQEQRDKESLINSTDDLIWSISSDLILITGNNAFITFIKNSTGIDLKPGDIALIDKKNTHEYAKFWKKLYLIALKGKSFKQEVYSIGLGNVKAVWYEINVNPIYDNNQVIGVACYGRNITDKKTTELKLKENSELFEKLTSNIPAALYKFEISSDGMMSFPYISKGIQKINPIIDIELIKTDVSSAFAAVHPDDLEKLLISIEVSKNNLSDWELEYRSIVSEDNIRWMKGKSSPEKRTDGTIVWYGYFQDITEEKLNTEKIRISKERYDIIAKATNDTIWDWDLKTNSIKWNKGIIGVFGYRLNETKMNIDWWFSKIHPKDVVRVRENLYLRISKQESRWEDEYRFCCSDGTYKYIHDRGFLVVNDGVPVRMIGAMQDITERKQVEAKYFESELRFKTIFEAEPECVKLVDLDGKLIEMNRAGLTMLEANSIEEVNSHSLLSFILPKYQSAYKKLHQQVMEGQECNMEYEAMGLGGTKRWMETNAVPIKDINGVVTMMLSVTRDISSRKKEEHHLKLLESVITNTNDAIMITEAEPFDEPGPKIVYVNDAFTKMTGYAKEEVIGKSPRILQGPKTARDELKRMRESMKKWKPCEITVVNYKKNGEEFWINFSIKPIADETGWFTHWISVERDVTQQKNDELEREQIIAELSQNNIDLKQFSYVTSHNLRAPIANLLGLTSLIDHYKVPNKSLKQILDGIKQSAVAFDDTVKDLTKVLVIKDQTNIIKEQISLVTVVDCVLRQLSISLDENTIKVNYEFEEAPFVVFTSTYLESILLNLFTNAIKYKSPKRKLKINISSSNIDGFVVLKFEDNGIGIDTNKYRDKLFKLYQRFHDNPDGKGLGLYLIKSQIEALGGTISIESKVGKGTTFIMKFRK